MMPKRQSAESTNDTVYQLKGVNVRAVAEQCLEVAQAFLDEAPYWGKPELAMWLLGPYSQVARHVHAIEVSAPPSLRQIDALTVENLLANAREEVLHALERLHDPSTSDDVAFAMISAGFVTEIVDAHGRTAWLPTPAARRLADRVLSLFVAGHLTMQWSVPLAAAA
jgi:hypothetical protein